MGAYRAAVVTAEGQNLIAQALANKSALEFISAQTSSYAYPSGVNIMALTGLQDVEQSVIPSGSQVINSNVAQISVRFDNEGVTQPYAIQTIGLYAKVGNGEETLFSVIRAITPDEMPVQSDTSPSAFIYNIQHTIQNAAQITMVVNPAGTATVQDILNIENPTFDDSGEVEGINSFPDFLGSIVNKMNLFQFFRNLKAGMKYVLHMGKLVNNGLCDTPGQFALDAAYGKYLQDQLTKLNSDLGSGRKPNDTDLNTLISAGVWWVGTNSSSFNHFPEDSVNGWLQVFSYNNEVKQIFYRYGTLNYSDYYTYVRTYNSSLNQWSEWKRLLTN
ncbi:MAG: hypothetical protein HFG54_14455 [Lachnospiraceae bacterium]|nr:hypothetical protein [Lachnospiraceae bacterium]